MWLPGQLLQGIGVGATLPVLSSAALAEVAKGGSYATSSAVVSTTRQLGAVLGVAVMVILIGKPEHGTAEEALRRGWAMAAICFIAVAVAAAVLGRTNRNPVQMPAPEPAIAPRLEPPIPSRRPRRLSIGRPVTPIRWGICRYLPAWTRPPWHSSGSTLRTSSWRRVAISSTKVTRPIRFT